jgi:hypothetical protein
MRMILAPRAFLKWAAWSAAVLVVLSTFHLADAWAAQKSLGVADERSCEERCAACQKSPLSECGGSRTMCTAKCNQLCTKCMLFTTPGKVEDTDPSTGNTAPSGAAPRGVIAPTQ